MRSEGDVNQSEARQRFVARHLSDETRQLLDEDARYFLHQSLSTPCLNALQSAAGSEMTDLQDRAILDFHGNSVHQIGHAHPRVCAAVVEQLQSLAFCPRRFTNHLAVELAKRLSSLAPVRKDGDPPRVLLAPGGALAMGMALKLARYATGRFKTISMWESFHGASLDSISIGGEALFRRDLGPLLPGCLHVPPYSPSGIGRDSADYIDYVLEKEGDIAAVIAEPMRWTTVVAPPASYWQQIRTSCDKHGALLIIDEIPSCLGRTGKMFCIEHFDIEPDMIVVGKGLGGGIIPLAGLIARGDLNVVAERALGHYTHEKSPLGAAAALATLDVIAEEQLLSRTAELGRRTLQSLSEFSSKNSFARQARGLGLQLALELDCSGPHGDQFADRVLYTCMERGLSFKVTEASILTLTPPLTVSDNEMHRALAIIEGAIVDCSSTPET